MNYAGNKGFVYLWALFAVTVAGVVMAATGQVWQTKMQREKELELLFIGDQFRKAIMSYYNNQLTGVRQYPESLKDLLEDKRGATPIRHLRKIYVDPMTWSDEWGIVKEEDAPQQAPQQTGGQNNVSGNARNTAGSGAASISKGIVGVYSLSSKPPLKRENFPEDFVKFSEAETYQDWQFVHEQQSNTGKEKASSSQSQQDTSAGGSSPFGAPTGGAGSAQGSGSSTSASPFAPPASGQGGQNPFAQ